MHYQYELDKRTTTTKKREREKNKVQNTIHTDLLCIQTNLKLINYNNLIHSLF